MRRPPYACCRACRAARGETVPLIQTFAWASYEFYCLDCGAHYGWLEPLPEEPTADLDAKHERYKSEWAELGGGDLLGGGVMLTDCAACAAAREPHIRHATDAEKDAHRAALARISARVLPVPA